MSETHLQILRCAREFGPNCYRALRVSNRTLAVAATDVQRSGQVRDATVLALMTISSQDRGVAEEFYGRLRSIIKSMVLRRASNRLSLANDSSEIIQSTLGDFLMRMDKGAFKFQSWYGLLAYLRRIVNSKTIIHGKKSIQGSLGQVHHDAEELVTTESTPLSKLIRKEDQLCLEGMLGRFNENDQLLIMLWWQGLTYEEIGDYLGKSAASVRVRFSRLIKKMRGWLH